MLICNSFLTSDVYFITKNIVRAGEAVNKSINHSQSNQQGRGADVAMVLAIVSSKES